MSLKVVYVAYSIRPQYVYIPLKIRSYMNYEKIDFPMLYLCLMFGFPNVRNNNEGGKLCYCVFGLEVYNIKLP